MDEHLLTLIPGAYWLTSDLQGSGASMHSISVGAHGVLMGTAGARHRAHHLARSYTTVELIHPPILKPVASGTGFFIIHDAGLPSAAAGPHVAATAEIIKAHKIPHRRRSMT